MRKIHRPYRKFLLPLGGVALGAAMFTAFGVLIAVLTTPEKPLVDMPLYINLPVSLLGYGAILPLVYGLFGLVVAMIATRGKRIFIDGHMLDGFVVYDSLYTSLTLEGLEAEVREKLKQTGFVSLDEKTFYRPGFMPRAFYFADKSEFTESADKLLERSNAVWKAVMEKIGGAAKQEIQLLIFLPLLEVTDEQIMRVGSYKSELLEKSEALCQICLHALSEKYAFVTCHAAQIQGQPFSVDQSGGAVFRNLCSGSSRPELPVGRIKETAIAGQRAPAAGGQRAAVAASDTFIFDACEAVKGNDPYAEAEAPAPPVGRRLDFKLRDPIVMQIDNPAFVFMAASAATLLGGFTLALTLWLALGGMDGFMFFCIFIPSLFMPGVLSVYFALSTYKKLVLDRSGAHLVRPLGNVTVLEGELKFADKFIHSTLTGKSMQKPVVYPLSDPALSEAAYPVNNYKRYIILRPSEQNKQLLEKYAEKGAAVESRPF
ncbi:MAG: hypothetical protein FWD58_05680 [Firmicutes bacterium]|nr:hypothetical protein [Bacillota bacterium]